MPKIKTFLLLTLVLVFSISLFGCGLFSSDTAAPEELTGQDGELPEWLLAAHREVEGPGTETTDDLAEEDDELAIGGADEDDGVTAPSAVQETPTQPATTNTSTPAPAPAPAPAPDPAPSNPQPGEKAYIAWVNANGATGTYDPSMATWYAETAGFESYKDWLKRKKDEPDEDAFGDDWGETPDWLN